MSLALSPWGRKTPDGRPSASNNRKAMRTLADSRPRHDGPAEGHRWACNIRGAGNDQESDHPHQCECNFPNRFDRPLLIEMRKHTRYVTKEHPRDVSKRLSCLAYLQPAPAGTENLARSAASSSRPAILHAASTQSDSRKERVTARLIDASTRLRNCPSGEKAAVFRS